MLKELIKQVVGCQQCGRCCRGCVEKLGYFQVPSGYLLSDVVNANTVVINNAMTRFRVIAEQHGFDKVDGFLSDTGCILPYDVRSITCLSYFCGNIVDIENRKKLDKYLKLLRKKRKYLF